MSLPELRRISVAFAPVNMASGPKLTAASLFLFAIPRYSRLLEVTQIYSVTSTTVLTLLVCTVPHVSDFGRALVLAQRKPGMFIAIVQDSIRTVH